jgi:hypothetical protein
MKEHYLMALMLAALKYDRYVLSEFLLKMLLCQKRDRSMTCAE